jgi:hypothetical protein
MILRVFFETEDYTAKQAARWSLYLTEENFFMSENSGSIARVEMDPDDQSRRTIAVKICDGSQADRHSRRLRRYNHICRASHSQR